LYVLAEASRRAIFFCCRSADGLAPCTTFLRMMAPLSLASASVIFAADSLGANARESRALQSLGRYEFEGKRIR
jgi:hypothetical protein